MTNLISLGLGEQAVSRNSQDVLVAYGLGSCLGVCMIDPQARVAGLLHAVLPERTAALETNLAAHPAKYVDCGIESLLAEMLKEGALKSRIIVRMAGGANMLISPAMVSAFDIGTRNIEKARETLKRLGMKITAEEVGGHKGRTVRMYVADNRVTVKLVGEKEHDL
jgi:chemotaxis protein CheD